MKLSDTEIEAAVVAVSTSMARTKLEQWPDGLLLQLLQLDQLTKLNEQVVGLKKAHLGAINKMADLLEVIEKHLPAAPHVPDEEEAAEAEWQAQMNRELEHASIVDPVGVRQVRFADILSKKFVGITPDVVLASVVAEALRAEGLKGYARQVSGLLSPAGFRVWGHVKIRNQYERVWVSKGFFEVLQEAENPGQLIREYLAKAHTDKTPEHIACPAGAPVIDPDHYA